jgi:hypothetical protein
MSPTSTTWSARRSWALDVLLAVLVPAVLVAAMYLFPFIRDPHELPFGADTYGYMWRSDLVRAEGVGALTVEGTGHRKSLGERPAYPVVFNLLRSITGASSLELMWALPAAIAAAIAIAAAGLAIDATDDRRLTAGLVGVGVAASAFVTQTAVGYGTNLMFDVIALSVAALAIRTATRSTVRGWAGAGSLLGAGALFHWLFAILFALLLLVFAALVAVGRVSRTEAARPQPGSALRIAAIVAIGIILAASAFLFAPEYAGRLPGFGGGGRGTRLRLPHFDLAITLPAAAVGAGVMLLVKRPRRWSLGMLIPWAGLAVVGLVGWFWLDLPTRPYRFAGFALGIPLLIVLGASTLEHLHRGRVVRAAAMVLAAAAVIGLASGGIQSWWHRSARHGPELFSQLGIVARYAERLPGEPLLVLPYRGPPIPPLSPVRAGLPVPLYDRVVLVRSVERAPGGPDGGRVVIHLDAINRRPAQDGALLGAGVTLLEGPLFSVPPVAPPQAPGPAGLALLVAVTLLTMIGLGSGWAVGFTDLSPVGAISASPAFGLAALGLFGTIASRLGAPLRGGSAFVMIAATMVAGWAMASALRWRRRRRPGETGP